MKEEAKKSKSEVGSTKLMNRERTKREKGRAGHGEPREKSNAQLALIVNATLEKGENRQDPPCLKGVLSLGGKQRKQGSRCQIRSIESLH